MIDLLSINHIDEINDIARHPDIKDKINDDNSIMNDLDLSTVIGCDNVHLHTMMSGDTVAGFIFLHPFMTNYILQVHICVLPQYRGEFVVEHCIESRDIIFSHENGYDKIVGITPVYLYNAIALSKLIGFRREGILRKSFRKNGKLYDQVISGICKEDF